MPQQIEKLKAIVKELEAELESLDTVDEHAQQVLEAALEDLRNALRKADSAPIESADSLIERFRWAEENFQVSHPTLAGLVVRMINALGQLGI
jgi:DNA repair exonuclease SbcCD ATPase subunit